VALWSKHDLRKDGLERQRYSGLQKTEFLRLLSAFAISSYTAADYDMREAQIERHFKAAVQLSGVNCDEEGFLKDLTVSTSLAVYDGPYIRFLPSNFSRVFCRCISVWCRRFFCRGAYRGGFRQVGN
jgi:hypothetical protein